MCDIFLLNQLIRDYSLIISQMYCLSILAIAGLNLHPKKTPYKCGTVVFYYNTGGGLLFCIQVSTADAKIQMGFHGRRVDFCQLA